MAYFCVCHDLLLMLRRCPIFFNHIGYYNFEDKYGCTYKGPIITYQVPIHKGTAPMGQFFYYCIFMPKKFSIIIIYLSSI